jgi:hypothetical protein
LFAGVALEGATLRQDLDDNQQIYGKRLTNRTTKAMLDKYYNHRGESTKIDFRGTPLLPEARGEATVESKQGAIGIDARTWRDCWPATSSVPST